MLTFIQEKWPFTTKRRMNMYIEQIEDDTRDTHAALWKILNVLCDEFDIKLGITARDAGVDE